MESMLLITVVIVLAALTFDLINGFHDTANAIATSVSTKALKPRHAIVMAATMNFIGAVSFTGVAKRSQKISLIHFDCHMARSSCWPHFFQQSHGTC
ncbi:Low-affinity inorganic phosphate transporter 1 [Listeria grayi]|uniref:Low-affinity inorganic phosphate transporter 1 n=1 Tax=Listeria grayi TaxID=1641 RepID=A0A378MCQ5_LISGR|nr:Low-affinity inorganic phosphate transporter 1 [Listeria grayi]